MTKRHFIAFANVLKSLKPATTTGAGYRMWVDAVQSIASVCGSSNPRFNRETFYSACGLDRS
jgi:hypothetical protein